MTTTTTGTNSRILKKYKKAMRWARFVDSVKQVIQPSRKSGTVATGSSTKQSKMLINVKGVMNDGDDVESPALKHRQLVPAGCHQAFDRVPQEDDAGSDYVDDEVDGSDDEASRQASAKLKESGLSHAFKNFLKTRKEEKKKNNQTYDPIAGNIYRYWAMNRGICGQLGLEFNNVVKTVGMMACVIIQVIAPSAVVISTLYKLEVDEMKLGLCTWYNHKDPSAGISWLTSRILGLVFIIAYTLWAIEKVNDERADWLKLNALNNLIESSRGSGCARMSPTRFYLWIGPAINCSMFLICAIAMGLLLKVSESPKDIVFDALSLLFLINLDDIDSDLGLLGDEDWEATEVGRFVWEQVQRSDGPQVVHDTVGNDYFVKRMRENDFATDPRITPDEECPERMMVDIEYPGTLVDHDITSDHPAYHFTQCALLLILLVALFFWFFVQDVKLVIDPDVAEYVAEFNEKYFKAVLKKQAQQQMGAGLFNTTLVLPKIGNNHEIEI